MTNDTDARRFVVVQRDRNGQIADVYWPDRRRQLYTRVEAVDAAASDNKHDDGYVSTVAEVLED